MANTPKNLARLAGAVALGAALVCSAAEEKAPELVSGASARMLSETCAGCHGTDGASVGPAAPTIAGMNAEYFVEIMQGFASDEIYSTVMGRIARGYTEEEIAAMAGFFAGKDFVAAPQQFDKALADTGAKLHDKYCEKCHSEGGKILEDEEYYILAGQWTPYLENALSDFIEERRPMPKKMGSKLEDMLAKEGKDSVQALFAYYASQQ